MSERTTAFFRDNTGISMEFSADGGSRDRVVVLLDSVSTKEILIINIKHGKITVVDQISRNLSNSMRLIKKNASLNLFLLALFLF